MTPTALLGDHSQVGSVDFKQGAFFLVATHLSPEDISHHSEAGNKLRAGLTEYLLWGAYLLNRAIADYGDTVSQRYSFFKIMGDVNRGDPILLVYLP